MSRLTRLWPLAAIAAASLAACGGSDSGSNSTPTATTSGVVTGSYFEHAKVCIDANNNAKCDSDEALHSFPTRRSSDLDRKSVV